MLLHLVAILGCLSGLNDAATNVGGILYGNTVWSSAGAANPYYLISDVQVPRNVTLTIQHGVTVNFGQGDFEIYVKGMIKIQGTSGQPVIFEGGSAGDLKYMINFQKTQLNQSSIVRTQFRGPKKAVQLTNTPANLQQNTGTLVIQSSTFTANTEIAANADYPRNNKPSAASIELRSCTLTQAKVTSFTYFSESIRILNGIISYVTFNSRAGLDGVQIIDSVVRNVTIVFDNSPGQFKLINSNIINGTVSYTSGGTFTALQSVLRDMTFFSTSSWTQSGLVLQNSTMHNFSMSGAAYYNLWYYQYSPLTLSVRNCKLTLGAITLYRYTTNTISIRDSTLTKVNISTIVPNDNNNGDYNYGTFTMRNSEFLEGILYLPSLTTEIVYSNATLIRTPLAMSRNSRIICSMISRSASIPQNGTLALNITSLTLDQSTIKNFETAIQISPSDMNNVTISKTNFHSISQIYIDNKAAYDILATGNYWGTNSIAVIRNKTLDYWDDIHYGEVFNNNYASSPLAAETGCGPYVEDDWDGVGQTTSSPYWGK